MSVGNAGLLHNLMATLHSQKHQHHTQTRQSWPHATCCLAPTPVLMQCLTGIMDRLLQPSDRGMAHAARPPRA